MGAPLEGVVKVSGVTVGAPLGANGFKGINRLFAGKPAPTSFDPDLTTPSTDRRYARNACCPPPSQYTRSPVR